MTALLEVRDLRIKSRTESGNSVPIIKGVSFKVERGEVVALIGESGSGKTTIALSALAYCKPGLEFTGGEVLLDGCDVLRMTNKEKRDIRGSRIAYVAQSAAATFNPALTIGAQVTESAVLHGILNQRDADKRAQKLYQALDLPNSDGLLGQRYPHQVSGGQLQRLMAAMALIGRPDLLILDEPTTALDVTTQIEVLKSFKKVIKEEGAAAIYVTHDLAVVAQIADRLIVLQGGEIEEQGTTEQVISRPTQDYTRRLIAAVRPTPAAAEGVVKVGSDTHQIPALEARRLTAGYGRQANGTPKSIVLRDINFKIERGHVVGVIGESGCGKSTLARVLAGLLSAAAGELVLNGEALAPNIKQRTRNQLQNIQIVFQTADTVLNPRQRVEEIIGRPLDFYGGLRGKEKQNRVAELLTMVELPTEFMRRFPEELSGGQKQRVNLARALAAEPVILLCDEVTSALDTIIAASVIELLKNLRRETGVSFVFISHDLSTVAAIADEITVLYAGRVVEKGSVDQVLSPPYHPYTRLLIASVPELRVGWLENTTKTREALVGIDRPVTITETGCPFFDRCPSAIVGTCDNDFPKEREFQVGHFIACHQYLLPGCT